MMQFGWAGPTIAVLLVVASVAAAAYLLWPRAAAGASEGRTLKAVTLVLAGIGILALLGVGAMALMHFGMMGGLMSCCR